MGYYLDRGKFQSGFWTNLIYGDSQLNLSHLNLIVLIVLNSRVLTQVYAFKKGKKSITSIWVCS